MQKVVIILLCLMVVLALLVSMGLVQERGYFSAVEQLYDKVQPIFNMTEAVFNSVFPSKNLLLEDDDYCQVTRFHFSYNDTAYYCDVIDLVAKAFWSKNGKAYIVDHNYSAQLNLDKFGMRNVISCEGVVLYDRILFFAGSSREFRQMTYREYCESIKGVSGRLEDIPLF